MILCCVLREAQQLQQIILIGHSVWNIPDVKLPPQCKSVLAYDLAFTNAWITHKMPFGQYLFTHNSSEFTWKCEMHRKLLNTKALPWKDAPQPSSRLLFWYGVWGWSWFIQNDKKHDGMVAEKADCRAKCGWVLGLGREEWVWHHLQNRSNKRKVCKKEAEKNPMDTRIVRRELFL